MQQSTRYFSVHNYRIELIFAYKYSPDLSASYEYINAIEMFIYNRLLLIIQTLDIFSFDQFLH